MFSPTNHTTDTEECIDLVELLYLIEHNLFFIILCCCLTGLIGFFITHYLMTPIYEASSTLIVNSRTTQTDIITNDQITSSQNLADTYSIIIKSDTILNQVISNLALSETYQGLHGKVVVAPVNGTQVMRISFRDAAPKKALAIVEEIVRIAPDIIIDIVEAGSVKTISKPSVTAHPVSPSLKKNVALSTCVGGFLAILFVFLRFILDNTLKCEYDITKKLNLPVLGVIPFVEDPPASNNKKGVNDETLS